MPDNRELEIRLRLAVDFKNAASQAAEQLENIQKGIDAVVKDSAKLDGIAPSIATLTGAFEKLKTGVSSVGGAMDTAARATGRASTNARKVATDVGAAGAAAKAAAGSLDQVAASADKVAASGSGINKVAADVTNVSTAATAAQKSFDGLMKSVDRVGSARLGGMETALDNMAKRAMTLGDAVGYAADQMGRLNGSQSRPYSGRTPEGGPANLAPYVFQDATRRAAPARPSYTDANFTVTGNIPAYVEQLALTTNALRRTRAEAKAAAAAMGEVGAVPIGGERSAPYSGRRATATDFGRNALVPTWTDAQWAPGAGDEIPNAAFRENIIDAKYREIRQPRAPRMPGVPTGADAGFAAGKGLYSVGDQMQSVGFANLTNAAMLGGVLSSIVKSGAATESMMANNAITIRANGGNQQAVDTLNRAASQAAMNNGSNFNDTVQALSKYVTTLSPGIDVNDAGYQGAIRHGMDRVSKLSMVTQGSGNALAAQDAAVGINQAITNLGMDVSTPEKLAQKTDLLSNALIKLKGVSISDVGTSLQFLKVLGPLAASAHQSPEDVFGLMEAFAKEKMTGATAANAAKRLFQRETIPVEKTQALQKLLSDATGGRYTMNMYDKNGKARSLIDVIGDIAGADKMYGFSDKQRAQIVGQASGLYAFPQISAVLNLMEKHGGVAGIKAMGQDIMHGGIEGARPGEGSLDTEARIKSETFSTAATKVQSQAADSMAKSFKVMEPDLVNVLHGISELITMFDRLPQGAKKGIFEVIGGMVALNAVTGVAGILFGNTFKAAGSAVKVGAWALSGWGKEAAIAGEAAKGLGGFVTTMSGQFSRIVPVVTNVAGWFSRLGPAMVTAFSEGGVAAEGFGVALAAMAGPVGWTIAGISAAVLALTAAWTHDWGNIRENTKVATDNIVSGLNAFDSWLRGLFKGIGNFIVSVWRGTGDEVYRQFIYPLKMGLQDVADMAGAAFRAVMNIPDPNAKFSQADHPGAPLANRDATTLNNALGFAAPAKAAALGNPAAVGGLNIGGGVVLAAPDQRGPRLSKLDSVPVRPWAAPAATPAPAARPIVPDIDSGPTATPAQKAAFDKNEADLFAAKAKKKKKPKVTPDDIIVDIGDLGFADVKAQADRIARRLKEQHSKLKSRFIDIYSKDGDLVERTFGIPETYELAKKDLRKAKGDPVRRQASDYMEKAKYYGYTPDQEITTLQQLLKKTVSDVTKGYIEGMIQQLKKNVKKSESAVSRHVDGIMDQALGREMDTSGNRVGTGGTAKKVTQDQAAFEKARERGDSELQGYVETQKKATASTEELFKEMNAARSEMEALQSAQAKLKSDSSDYNAQIEELTKSEKANGANKADIERKIQSLRERQDALNTSIDANTHVINQASNAYRTYQQQLKDAAAAQDTFANALIKANQAGTEAASQKGGELLGQGVADVADKLLGTSKKGFTGQILGAYANAYGKSIGPDLLKQIMGQSTEQLGKSDSAPMHIADSQGLQQATDSNTHLKSIADSTSKMADSMQSSTGIKVDTGNFATGGTQAASNPYSDTNPYGVYGLNADGSIPSNMQPKKSWLQTNGIKTAVAAYSALSSAYTGITQSQGGVGAGLSTGLSTGLSVAAFSTPWTAIAAGVVTGVAAAFSHHDDPSKMADKYDTQNYGQMNANMLGAGLNNKVQVGANGQSFMVDNATATETNNMGLLQSIQLWAQNNANNSDATIAKVAQDDITKYGAYNASITNPDDLISHDPKNIGNEKVVGGTESGTYSSLYNDMTSAQEAISKLADASLQAAQNAKALADSFTATMIGGPSGFLIPYLGGAGGGGTAQSSFVPKAVSPASTKPDSGLSLQTVRQALSTASNNTTIGGAMVSLFEGAQISTDPATLQQQIQQALPYIIGAVNQANYNQGRYLPGYVSQLQ